MKKTIKNTLSSVPGVPRIVRGVRACYRTPHSELEALRLQRRLPVLKGLDERIEVAADRLSSSHDAYTRSVSNELMAASLRLSSLLAALCEILQPKRVLELGSGFTSAVLRGYAARTSARVWSVEDDPYWLEQTRAYLKNAGFSDDGLLSLEDSTTTMDGLTFDLVFHDLGDVATRGVLLDGALQALEPGGIAVLDDAQKPGYLPLVKEKAASRGHGVFSLRKWTEDTFGRYSVLVSHPHTQS